MSEALRIAKGVSYPVCRNCRPHELCVERLCSGDSCATAESLKKIRQEVWMGQRVRMPFMLPL